MNTWLKRPLHSIHIPHNKNTKEMPTVDMPIPEKVSIQMQQHIGPPGIPAVKKGEQVLVGQVIADNPAPLGVPIHASVSGTVLEIEEIRPPRGPNCQSIVIESDGEQKKHPSFIPHKVDNLEEFIEAVRKSGMVGLGGAGFPTYIKYSPRNLSDVDTLLINATECEPYITANYRSMLQQGDELLDGIETIMGFLNIERCIIAIEKVNGRAIEHLRSLLVKRGNPNIVVKPLQSTYPQGAEKVLIYQVTGRVLPMGKLPADVGTIVSNVESVIEIAVYLRSGQPLIYRTLTVDGDAIQRPSNVRVPIGTYVSDLVAFCGGYRGDPHKIMLGGPMMGIALATDQYPITKQNNAILAFTESMSPKYKETACIQCGECIRHCPMKLMPTLMKKAFDKKDNEELEELCVSLCIECGNCTYGCPAQIELTESFRLAKTRLRNASAVK